MTKEIINSDNSNVVHVVNNVNNIVLINPTFGRDSIGRVIATFNLNVRGDTHFISINNSTFTYEGETVHSITIED